MHYGALLPYKLLLTRGWGVDVVVEMVGLPEILKVSLRSLGKGGCLVFVGAYVTALFSL